MAASPHYWTLLCDALGFSAPLLEGACAPLRPVCLRCLSADPARMHVRAGAGGRASARARLHTRRVRARQLDPLPPRLARPCALTLERRLERGRPLVRRCGG